MEIEQVAVEAPERIAKLWPDPFAGPQPYEIRQLAFAGLAHAPELRDRVPKLVSSLVTMTSHLWEVAASLDALTCEINPLVLTPEGALVAADTEKWGKVIRDAGIKPQ